LSRTFKIACVEGDGIGPEVFAVGRSVLEALQEAYSLNFDLVPAPMGDRVLKERGEALPRDSFNRLKECDLCLKGPVGETAKDTVLRIRQELDLFANLRPARNYPFIKSQFTGVDMLIVRENTEDLYLGKEFEEDGGKKATAFKIVTEKACKRIAKYAFDSAVARRNRRKKEASVVCVQKANVLKKTDGLFLRCCSDVAKKFPEVKFSSMYVDSAAMNLIRNPQSFDVMVTSNLYGDILSDEASEVVGGLGVAPSANIGTDFALFEPVHGSAPDITGKEVANPLAMIFTIRLMLEWLADTRDDQHYARAAEALEQAVVSVSSAGFMTPDIGGKSKTSEVGKALCNNLLSSRCSGSDGYERNLERNMEARLVREDVSMSW